MEAHGSRRQILISIGLVILIIVLLLALVDVGMVFSLLLQADWRLLLLGAAFLVLCYALITLRSRYLLANQTGYRETLHVDSSGFMLSVLMQIPSSAYRVLAIDRTTSVEMPQATSAMVVEILLGSITRLLALALAIVLVAADLRGAEQPLLLGLILLGLLLAILFWSVGHTEQIEPKLAGGLERVPRIDEERAGRISSMLIRGFESAGSPRRFGVAFIMTLAFWLCGFAFYFFAARAFDLDVPIPYLLIALVALVVAPPSSPLMAGIFHGLVVTPLVAFNLLEAEPATAYAVFIHAVQMVCLLALGFWGLNRMGVSLGELLAEMRKRVGRNTAEDEMTGDSQVS
jgi:uncharacterized protein (TIRG00374 family)